MQVEKIVEKPVESIREIHVNIEKIIEKPVEKMINVDRIIDRTVPSIMSHNGTVTIEQTEANGTVTIKKEFVKSISL